MQSFVQVIQPAFIGGEKHKFWCAKNLTINESMTVKMRLCYAENLLNKNNATLCLWRQYENALLRWKFFQTCQVTTCANTFLLHDLMTFARREFSSHCHEGNKTWLNPQLCSHEQLQFCDAEQASLAQRFALVCSRRAFLQHAKSIFMSGTLLGAICFGVLADKCGRATTYMAAFVLMMCGACIAAYAPFLWTYLGARFLTGFGAGGGIVTLSTITTGEQILIS